MYDISRRPKIIYFTEYVIQDYDDLTKNDEILSKNIGIVSSSGDSPTIKITNDIFSKGTSGIWGDSDNEKQNYFKGYKFINFC